MAVEGELTLVPLTRADFPMVVEWLARPHVAEWWHRPQGAVAFEGEYGPVVDGADPTRVCICSEDGVPVGFVQYYRLDDEPGYAEAVGVAQGAGLDLFVADTDRRGHGLGPRIIAATVARIFADYPDLARAMASPSVHNARSIRAFEKAGFEARGAVTVPKEPDPEMVMVCERPGPATAG